MRRFCGILPLHGAVHKKSPASQTHAMQGTYERGSTLLAEISKNFCLSFSRNAGQADSVKVTQGAVPAHFLSGAFSSHTRRRSL